MLPGTISILCALSHQKEERAGKYYSVLSLPISLQKFEVAKTVIIVEKLLIASLFLALFTSVNNAISPTLAVYSVGQNMLGSICIVLASIWQIPLCLYLARKARIMLPIIINTLFGIIMPIVFGKSAFSWVCPYFPLRGKSHFAELMQKKNAAISKILQRLLKAIFNFAGCFYLFSFSTSEISFAVAVTIRMPLSLISSRRASSCRRFVSFPAGVSKRNRSTDIL